MFNISICSDVLFINCHLQVDIETLTYDGYMCNKGYVLRQHETATGSRVGNVRTHVVSYRNLLLFYFAPLSIYW